MKDKSLTYIIIVIILVMILGSLFIYTNVLGHSEKNNNSNNNVIKTTKKVKPNTPPAIDDKIEEIESHNILIGDEIRVLKLKKYIAIKGFSVEFPYEYFNASKINTSTVAFISNVDNNTFIKVESLSETAYYNEYNMGDNYLNVGVNEKDGYDYEYKYFRGNGLYLKITKCIRIGEEDLSISPMMDFMINSLDLE